MPPVDAMNGSKKAIADSADSLCYLPCVLQCVRGQGRRQRVRYLGGRSVNCGWQTGTRIRRVV